jgi:ribosomal protein L12E/L44/L45/RPP1/RPP2
MAEIFSRERAAGEPAATAPEAAAAAGRTKRRPERADTEEDEDSTSSATVSRCSALIVKDSVIKVWHSITYFLI